MSDLFPITETKPPELVSQRSRVDRLQGELEKLVESAGDNYSPAVHEKIAELDGAKARLDWLETIELNKAKQ